LTEDVSERENLKEALRLVKANKCSAGVDGTTVGDILERKKGPPAYLPERAFPKLDWNE
jgi:hypothetical protein